LDAIIMTANCIPLNAKTRRGEERVTLPFPVLHWACLLTLLLIEIVGLTVRFDTASVSAETGWWALPVDYSPQLFRLGSLIVLVTFGLNWAQLGNDLTETFESRQERPSWGLALLAHLFTMGLFYGLTVQVLERPIASATYPGLWVLAWIVAGSLTVML
jgi:hypothetical protein